MRVWVGGLLSIACGFGHFAALADEATDQFNVASGLFNMNRYSLAAEEYQRFLDKYPKHEHAAEAWYFLGESHVFLKQFAKAQSAYRVIIQQYPKFKYQGFAQFRLGETSYLLGDYKGTAAHLDGFWKANPEHKLLSRALPYLGRAYLELGDTQKAKASLEKGLQLKSQGPLRVQNQFDLGRTYELLNQSAEAQVQYRTVAASTNGLADDAQLALGILLFRERDYQSAATVLGEFETKFSTSPLVGSARLNQALCLYQTGSYPEAEKLLRRLAGDGDAGSAEASYWLGLTIKAQTRYKEAAELLHTAYNRYPKEKPAAMLLYFAAESAWQGGEVSQAGTWFESFVREFPKHERSSDALVFAAEAAQFDRDADKVVALSELFSEHHPNDSKAARMGLILSQALIDTGKYAAALAALDQTLSQKPDPKLARQAVYYKGLAHRLGGKPEASLEALQPLLASDEQDPIIDDARYLAGASLYDLDQHQPAIEQFKKYLKSAPNSELATNVLSYLTLSYLKLGALKEVADPLSRLSAVAPKAASPIVIQVADAFYDAERFREASGYYQKAIDLTEANSDANARSISGQSWCRYHLKSYEAAAESFANLAQAHPDNSLAEEARYMEAVCYSYAKKTMPALEAYVRFVGVHPKSKFAFDAHRQIAQIEQVTAKPQAAIATLEKLAKLYPEHEQLDSVYNDLAWLHLEGGQEPKAVELWKKILTDYPGSALVPEVTLSLSESLFTQGQFGEVIERLKRIEQTSLPPDLDEAFWYRRGRSFVETGQWKLAAESLGALRQRHPESRLARESQFWIAEAARRSGDPKAAIAQLKQLLKAPTGNEPWLALAWLRLGQAQGELKLWADMLATLEICEQRYPVFPQANLVQYHLARALQNLARFDEARAKFKKAAAGRNDETSARSQFMIGECFFHEKNYRAALREFLKVEILYAFPQWQSASLLEAAKCHELLQEWSLAAETYNRLLSKYPNSEHVEEAKKRRQFALKKSSS